MKYVKNITFTVEIHIAESLWKVNLYNKNCSCTTKHDAIAILNNAILLCMFSSYLNFKHLH